MDCNAPLYLVRSSKGFDMLCLDNFIYHYEDHGSGIYRWACNRHKDTVQPCRSRILTTLLNGDETKHCLKKVLGEHSHERCTPDEIFKVFATKRAADAAAKPNNALQIKMLRQDDVEAREAKAQTTEEEHSTDFDSGDEEDEEEEEQETKETERSDMLSLKPDVTPQIVYLLRTPLHRQLISTNGFIYRLECKSEIYNTYRWECTRKRELGCRAQVLTQRTPNHHHNVIKKSAHCHKPYTQDKFFKLLKKHKITINRKYKQPRLDEELAPGKHEKGNFEEITFDVVDSLKCTKMQRFSDEESNQTDSDTEAPSTSSMKRTTKASKPPAKKAQDPLAKNHLKAELAKTKFTFLPSAKGNKVLCLDNFLYHFDSKSPSNERSYWTCVRRRDKRYKCNGRVTTEMSGNKPIIVKISGRHLHPDGTQEIKRRMYKEVVAKKAKETNMKPQEIIMSSIEELGDDFKEIVVKSKETIERRIGNLRQRMKHNNVMCDTPPEVEDGNESCSSVSSISSLPESVDDHFDYSNLPTKLEDMIRPSPKMDTAKPPDFLDMISNMEACVPSALPEVIDMPEEMPMEEDFFQAFYGDGTTFSNDDNKEFLNITALEQDPQEVTEQDYKDIIANLGKRKKADTDNQTPDMDVNKVSMLCSAKGGELLCVDGYIYHIKSQRNIRTYWTCIKCKDPKLSCKARVSTVMTKKGLKIFRVTNTHTHPINELDIKRRLYNARARQSTGGAKPRYMLEKSLGEISEEYANLVANSMGRFKTAAGRATNGKEGSTMKLYAVSDGPPSLAVRMTLKALNIPYELVNVDYIASEHLSDDYAKMNPQKEIPVLDDEGFYLSESIAIMQYLCDKYAKQTDFYPSDATQRAIVNQRLCFNMGFYYASISAHAMAPIFFDYQRSEMSLKKVNNSLDVFETYLARAGTKFAAADHATIADFALVSATLCLEAIGFDLSPFPLVETWYKRFKTKYPELWEIGKGGMQEIADFEKNPPNLSHMNHPFHPTRKQ